MKKPGQREALSKERILQSALRLVDSEGLEALSLRRVGQALGVEAMSLYNHIASKAELLDGLFELVLAPMPLPPRGECWTEALRAQARAFRVALQAHPKALPLFSTRAAITQGSLEHVEAVLGVLRSAGFSADKALSALQVLVAYVVGHTVSSHASCKPEEVSFPRYEGLAPESYPRVREAASVLAKHNVDTEFDFGLEALLEGFRLWLSRESRKRRSRASKRATRGPRASR